MMNEVAVWTGMSLNDDQPLPPGYQWGGHWSSPGFSGYYVIRDSDHAIWRASFRGAQMPILSHSEFESAFELNRAGN